MTLDHIFAILAEARELTGHREYVVSLPIVVARMRTTSFLDADEERHVKIRVEADRAWFDGIKAQREEDGGSGRC